MLVSRIGSLRSSVRKQSFELGTHNGVSFAAFCNAVSKAGLNSKCYAIDSWEGDQHAGQYGEEVFSDISDFATKNFPSIAILWRLYFDVAISRFAPKSIDILHIDGLHTYEAVSNDFHSWRSKLSDRGVVLFHDTHVQGSGFGVWRLWGELCQIYPHFNFTHSAGLGIIAVGSEIPPALAPLFEIERTEAGAHVRNTFDAASKTAQVVGSSKKKSEAERYLATIPDGRKNIALNCFTIQSSVEPGTLPAAFGAVDGVRTGHYGFHTAFESKPWWILDLGSEQDLDEVVVYNRLDADCRSRAGRLLISLASDGRSWRPVFHHEGPAFGGLDGAPLRLPLLRERARYVKLSLPGMQFLHLDQVEVYSPYRL